jgi:hypothetical protein
MLAPPATEECDHARGRRSDYSSPKTDPLEQRESDWSSVDFLQREVSQFASVEGVCELHTKLIDMAQASTQATFNLVREIASAETPSDVINVCTEHARKQFEMLAEQIAELAAIGQKIAVHSYHTVIEGC